MEQFVCGKYDQLAQLLTAQGKPLYRLFRVAHPVIALALDIRVEEEAPSYHILEQYMDQLLCGCGNEAAAVPVMGSKEMLFALLGVDGEGYDIALRFYEDLKLMGHFEELPDGSLLPLPAAYHSLQTLQEDGGKTARKFVIKQVGRKMLFDAYSLELMPGCFYNLEHQAMDPARVELREGSRYLWLDNRSHLLDSAVTFDQALKKADYQGQKAIDRGLPQGRTRLGVQPDAVPEVLYFPYYLAVLKDGGNYSMEVYDFRRLTQIPWLTQMYTTAAYKSARERIRSLCDRGEQVYLRNPLCEDFPLRMMGKLSLGNGINCEIESGNYLWTVQDWQVDYLIKTCGGADVSTLQMLLENPVAVISAKETGRTVTAKLTEEQRRRIREALEAGAAVDPELQSLRSTYREAVQKLGGKKADWLPQLEAIASKWPAAAFLLGSLYFHGGSELEKDIQKAYTYFLSASDNGHLLAKMHVMFILQNKESGYYDPKASLRYLDEAKKGGLCQAVFATCRAFEKLDPKGAKVHTAVVNGYLSAAKCGLVPAMLALARYADPERDSPEIMEQAAYYGKEAQRFELPPELKQ